MSTTQDLTEVVRIALETARQTKEAMHIEFCGRHGHHESCRQATAAMDALRNIQPAIEAATRRVTLTALRELIQAEIRPGMTYRNEGLKWTINLINNLLKEDTHA